LPTEPELALSRARRYCAYQERCEREVELKLKAWNVKPALAGQVIRQLKEENYIDDERFARVFVSGKFRINHWGRTKISYELKGKGIPENLINKALEEIDEEEYRNVLRELLSKKNREIKEEDPFVRKKKLVSFAMGKGFEYPIIKEAVDTMETG
jgi:regulatory protein